MLMWHEGDFNAARFMNKRACFEFVRLFER